MCCRPALAVSVQSDGAMCGRWYGSRRSCVFVVDVDVGLISFLNALAALLLEDTWAGWCCRGEDPKLVLGVWYCEWWLVDVVVMVWYILFSFVQTLLTSPARTDSEAAHRPVVWSLEGQGGDQRWRYQRGPCIVVRNHRGWTCRTVCLRFNVCLSNVVVEESLFGRRESFNSIALSLLYLIPYSYFNQHVLLFQACLIACHTDTVPPCQYVTLPVVRACWPTVDVIPPWAFGVVYVDV